MVMVDPVTVELIVKTLVPTVEPRSVEYVPSFKFRVDPINVEFQNPVFNDRVEPVRLE